MNLYFIPKDDLGCGFYRMFLPASKIKDMGLANVEIDMQYNRDKAAWADVIIIQRATDMFWYEEIIKLQAAGKKVVYEIDDLLYGVTPEANAWSYWNPITENLGRALLLMKQVNVVTVTTARLANEYGMHNRNIKVLPNYLPAEKWHQPQGWTVNDWNEYYQKKGDDTVRILWAGGANHKMDIEYISAIVTKVCQDNKNVRFVMMGYTPRELLPELQVYDPITNPGGQLEIVQGTNLLDYPSKIKGLAADIGIAPLVENSFNECKSPLKFLEYSALGMPTVASNIKPYSAVIRNGSTGYLANSGKEWYTYLTMLIQNAAMRNQIGSAARNYYEQNVIDTHINKWVKVYEDLVNVSYQW